jgi:electron transfer flavoprotein alpha subunit
MSTVLYIAGPDAEGTLAKSALDALTAAKEFASGLSASLVVGLVGGNAQVAANAVAGCGAARFFAVNGDIFAQARYATDAAAVVALSQAAHADYIVAAGGSRWNRVLPGAAHRLGGAADLHITKIHVEDGKPTATRWYYRQRMMGVHARSQRPWAMGVDPGTHEAWSGQDGTANVEIVEVAVAPRTQVTGLKSPQGDAQTIRPDAELLLVAGAGWTKKQADGQSHTDVAEKLILGFLDKTKASLGSSKSLVDLGGEGHDILPFMSHLNQVGQTGSTPRHAKGLSTCCHGEEPHVVGWRFVNERRAINTDVNCGWARGKADVVYVADAFAVMEKVNALLEG